MGSRGVWVSCISMGVLLVAFILLLGVTRKFAVVDMTRAIQEPAARIAHSKLSKASQGSLMARYTRLLPEVIEAYGASHRITVISAHVLSNHNTLDITPEIIEKTIQRLKHER